jgi:hypothetical protein
MQFAKNVFSSFGTPDDLLDVSMFNENLENRNVILDLKLLT